MNKPNNWENTQAYGDFEPLELGGHICKIMSVEETKSKKNKDMIKISLDIAEGEQAGYYKKQFKNDTRDHKKWGCIVYQLTEDNDGNTAKGFKTFINAVEKSNDGFNPNNIWNDKFSTYFKDKLIGGAFGREQYANQSGELKWSTKCVKFYDIESIKKGIDVPEDKLLVNNSSSTKDFTPVVNDDDDDLPF